MNQGPLSSSPVRQPHSRPRRAWRAAHLAAALLLLAFAARPAAAVKIPLGLDPDSEMSLSLGVLLQPQFVISNLNTAGTAPLFVPGDNVTQLGAESEQFYFRRARLILAGAVTKRLTFFIDTDIANWGKGGDWTQPFYVQDAMVMGEYVQNHFIDAGLILVPLSHATLRGAGALNAMDYASTIMRPPNAIGRAWRDNGVQFRGYFLDKRLHYRVGVFEGVGPYTAPAAVNGMVPPGYVLNPSGVPRVAGIVRFNILGTEPDFFFKGIYFTDKPILSVGIGADYQYKSTLGAKKNAEGNFVNYPADYLAFTADVFADIPLGNDMEFTASGTFYRHQQGEAVSFNNALGGVGEVGYRFQWISLVALFEMSKSTLSDDANPRAIKTEDWVIVHGGVNFWMRKHNANLKLDFGWARKGDTGATCDSTTAANFTKTACPSYTGTIQGQLLF